MKHRPQGQPERLCKSRHTAVFGQSECLNAEHVECDNHSNRPFVDFTQSGGGMEAEAKLHSSNLMLAGKWTF